MNKIAKTVFTDFSSLSTISKNFLHLTKNLDKKTLNVCSYKLDRNLITNIVNFSLYQENTILPKNYEIQSYVLIKDYNQNLILEEYCRLFSCKVTKKDYITYNLKIEDNIKRNKIKYINESTLNPTYMVKCNTELNSVIECPNIHIPIKNKKQIDNIIYRLFI